MDDRIQQVERELRLVKRYALGMTLAFGVLTLAAFRQATRTRFTEIDVERLNVVERSRVVRLALANPERLPHPGQNRVLGRERQGHRPVSE